MTLSDALGRISAALHATAQEKKHLPLSPPELEAATDAYFQRGGKLLRPALCLLIAHALGGNEGARRAKTAALATEYFHLFTLVHDDVIDHDSLRRGAPTAHVLAAEKSGVKEKAAEYGTSIAILAGDALLGRATELLAGEESLSAEARLALLTRLSGITLPRLLSGEALDTKLGYLREVPQEDTLSAVYRDKTGVLFAFALYAGAVCALNSAPEEQLVQAIELAAADIGVAFQLTDDYLGLTASEETMGKTALSDIREGKRTFFVRFAFDAASDEEKQLLSSVLGNRGATQEQVLCARDLLVRYGEDIWRARIAEARRRAEALLAYLPDETARGLLSDLFERMIHRER